MIFYRELTIVVILLLPAFVFPQVGKVGINTTNPQAMLHVKDSSVLFSSPFYINIPDLVTDPPASGDGVRMMWYPQKQAFRAGYIDGAQWDKINIGEGSFATGFNNMAKGRYSSAFGLSNNANGASSLVIGQYNDPLISAQTVATSSTPLFIIGNGDEINGGNLSNAFVVRKDGNVGIGNINPTRRLYILNRGASGGTPNANASVVLDDNNNQYLHLLNPVGYESGILHGRNGSSIRSGIVFNASSSIEFRSGGNTTRAVIDSLGNMGIGENAPKLKLDIGGGISFDEAVVAIGVGGVTINVGNRTYIIISSNGGADAREIHLSNGLAIGQLLILQSSGPDPNGFMIRDTDANIDINATVALLNMNDTITFIWDGDEWVELHRSNN